MKRIPGLITFALVCMLLIAPLTVCIAEAAGGDVSTDTPYTWEYLATIGGATVATLLIVQFAKAPLDKVWRIPTRWFVYVIALAIMICATAFTTGLSVQEIPLIALNAFMVALSAYGSYELTFAKKSM